MRIRRTAERFQISWLFFSLTFMKCDMKSSSYKILPTDTIGAVVVVVTCVMVYWDICVSPRKFTNYDDPVNYERNERVKRASAENLRWIFVDGALVGVYEPISNLMKMIVLSNVSEEYHATVIVRLSLMLHLANAWILVRVLAKVCVLIMPLQRYNRTNLSFALFLAVVTWSTHPLRVETIAWASCLPHMLANTFAMLCVNAHLNRIVLESESCFDSILFTTVMYALSVFSKTSTISLPGVLFILSVVVNRCKIISSTTKLMICMGFVSCIALLRAMSAQSQDYIQAGSLFDHLTFLSSITYALSAFAFYVSKTIWPVSITTWNPIPQWVVIATPSEILSEVFLSFSSIVGQGVLFGIVSSSIFLLSAILSRKKGKTAATAAAYYSCALLTSYIILLLPTLGVISHHSSALAADRYVYLPSAFVFAPSIMFIFYQFILPVLSKRFKHLLCICLIILLSIPSQHLVQDWSSSIRLWQRATEIYPNDAMPFSSLGSALSMERRDDEASVALRRALELNPAVGVTHSQLASVLFRQGYYEDAASSYLKAAEIRSSMFLSATNNAALSYERIGRFIDAKLLYIKVLETFPGDQNALDGLSRVGEVTHK